MSDERSLDPTPRKRKEARSEGRVAVSGMLVGAFIWMFVVSGLYANRARIVTAAREGIRTAWSSSLHLPNDEFTLGPDVASLTFRVLAILTLALAGIFSIAVLGRLAQIGFLWAPNRIGPARYAQPLGARFTEIFSLNSLVTAIRALFIMVACFSLFAGLIWWERDALAKSLLVPDLTTAMIELMATRGFAIGGLLCVVGLLDYLYQRYRLEQSLRMTPEEVRAEVKAINPNTQIDTGRRRLHQRMQAEQNPQ